MRHPLSIIILAACLSLSGALAPSLYSESTQTVASKKASKRMVRETRKIRSASISGTPVEPTGMGTPQEQNSKKTAYTATEAPSSESSSDPSQYHYQTLPGDEKPILDITLCALLGLNHPMCDTSQIQDPISQCAIQGNECTLTDKNQLAAARKLWSAMTCQNADYINPVSRFPSCCCDVTFHKQHEGTCSKVNNPCDGAYTKPPGLKILETKKTEKFDLTHVDNFGKRSYVCRYCSIPSTPGRGDAIVEGSGRPCSEARADAYKPLCDRLNGSELCTTGKWDWDSGDPLPGNPKPRTPSATCPGPTVPLSPQAACAPGLIKIQTECWPQCPPGQTYSTVYTNGMAVCSSSIF